MLSSFIQLRKQLNSTQSEVILDGTALTINEIVSVSRSGSSVALTSDKALLQRIETVYSKLIEQVESGIPIYGCNTGYGERASRVVNKGTSAERLALSKQISEGIAHVDVSVGPEFSTDVVRAAMLIRINMLMKGVSGVKISNLEIYQAMLNEHITPVVNQYGGIGASGDLAHNARVLSAARQLKGVQVRLKDGTLQEAGTALTQKNIAALKLEPKAGLGFVNGDNFSSALASLLLTDVTNILALHFILAAVAIEVLEGTNRSFHQMLASVRNHPGQQQVASIMRYLLNGSSMAIQEMDGHKKRVKDKNVQDSYSLRCMPQYHAVNIERILQSVATVSININSASDNPLWVTPEEATLGEEPWQWVSGGNFLAMHMVEVMDGLRKTMTHITKLTDRHLARIVNPNTNNGLPANLSDKKAITQCTFKGVQIQSGMFEVYSSLLSMPISTLFGTHEEGNQDITSHALTSGILGLENLRVTRYSLAQQAVALAQAVQLRGGVSRLSKQTRPLFEFLSDKISYIEKEKPLNNEIELVYKLICNGGLNAVVDNIYKEYKDEQPAKS